MELPESLRLAVSKQMETAALSRIRIHSQSISKGYRQRDKTALKPCLTQPEEALAYAVSRMPATYGAAFSALRHSLLSLNDAADLRTLLDIGAGTGTVGWAADALLTLDGVTCIEKEPAMRQLGEVLAAYGSETLRRAKWRTGDITAQDLTEHADLVTASYILNELDENKRFEVTDKLWQATRRILLLIEPGTPAGYGILRDIRAYMISKGAYVIAPCPHNGPCPITGDDWCHFTCRVPRNRAHRLAKDAEAPYEDEKYAYLALSRTPAILNGARVLRHPLTRKGHIQMTLCAGDGLRTTVITRKNGALYRLAQKARCGDWI